MEYRMSYELFLRAVHKCVRRKEVEIDADSFDGLIRSELKWKNHIASKGSGDEEIESVEYGYNLGTVSTHIRLAIQKYIDDNNSLSNEHLKTLKDCKEQLDTIPTVDTIQEILDKLKPVVIF